MGRNLLIFGTGIEFAHVKALAKNNNVIYYTEFNDAFPEFKEFASGVGFKNITKTTTPFTDLQKVDKVLTFDVYFSDLFQLLKESGFNTFGGGLAGFLELDRKTLKTALKSVGIPSPKWKSVKGLANVKPPCVVKLSFFRGSVETFFVNNEHELKSIIHKVYSEFGDFTDEIELIVEEPVDTSGMVEAGVDAFFNDGFVFPMLCGVEYKKGCYVGKVVNDIDELPDGIRDTILKLEILLKRVGYKGMISTEEFVNPKSGDHYFLDITVRGAYPLSLGYPYWIENYEDVILNDAKPKYKGNYVVAVPFWFEESRKQFMNIQFPDKDERYQFESLMKVNDEYIIPKSKEPMSGIVCEAYAGITPDKWYSDMQKLLDKVQGYSMNADLEKLPKAIKEFYKLW